MENQQENRYELINRHYYGHTVRVLFLIAGFLMIVTYPFFSDLITIPMPLSIGIMLLLVIFGGLINPVQKWLLVVNNLIPIVGFAVFEYQAAHGYQYLSISNDPRLPVFFWVNQLLSFIFFIALYLSVKTARGRFVKEIK